MTHQARFRKLTLSVRPFSLPVEIGCMELEEFKRDKGRLRAIDYVFEHYDDDGVREQCSIRELFGCATTLHLVLGEFSHDGSWKWNQLQIDVTLGGKSIFSQPVSFDDPHGIAFKPTDSPLGVALGNEKNPWIVGTVRWRGIKWTPWTLDVAPEFRFDSTKLLIPYFRFPIHDETKEAALVRNDAIRYDGQALLPDESAKHTMLDSEWPEHRRLSLLKLSRDGEGLADGEYTSWM